MLFLQKYWFILLIGIVMLYLLWDSQNTINEYKSVVKANKVRIRELQDSIKQDKLRIEQLENRDTIYVTEIKEIKIKGDEKIRTVDTMSVSSMQGFFTDRYNRKD